MRTLYYLCDELCRTFSTAITAQAGSGSAARRITIAAFGLFTLCAVILGISLFRGDNKKTRWATVSGYVLSKDGTPIEGVRISFLSEGSGVGASAETSGAGYYRLRGVLPGEYVVSLQPIIPQSNAILTAEQAASAREAISRVVPEQYQDFATSALHAGLTTGRNTFTIDFRMLP
jgi:hypothetical protein